MRSLAGNAMVPAVVSGLRELLVAPTTDPRDTQNALEMLCLLARLSGSSAAALAVVECFHSPQVDASQYIPSVRGLQEFQNLNILIFTLFSKSFGDNAFSSVFHIDFF